MEEFGVGVVVVESCDGEVELVRGLGDDGGVAACSDEDECWCGRHGWCIGCFRGKKREGRSRSVDRPFRMRRRAVAQPDAGWVGKSCFRCSCGRRLTALF